MARKKLLWKKWNNPIDQIDLRVKDLIDNDNFDVDIDNDNNPSLLSVLSTHDSDIDFYTLQTNFRITFELIERIAEIDGVEAINVISAYKARIGFPTSGFFNVQDIQKCIEELILADDIDINNTFDDIILEKYNPTILDKVSEIRDSLYKNKDYWALYVYPNGQTKIITDNKPSKYFNDKLEMLELLCLLVGGTLISSNDFELDNEK